MKPSMLVWNIPVVLGTALIAPRAHAYNYDTHEKLVNMAAEAMTQLAQNKIAEPAPPPDAAMFADYLLAIRAGFTNLSQLRTGLPNALPASGVLPLPFINNGTESYPFDLKYAPTGSTDADGNPTFTVTAPSCDFDHGDNLADISVFQIQDFHYKPLETSNGACGLVRITDPGTSPLPGIMGFHAGAIDDHVNDSVLWIKPTNTAAAEIASDIGSGALTLVIGGVILPFVCIAQWFSGHECNVTQPYDLATQINPVNVLGGLLPGIGDIRGDSFVGLWHHIHMDRQGEFNRYPGIHYLYAGPQGNPGAYDLGLMAAADLTGLSLNAYASDGDDFYGDLDEVNRIGPGPWQSTSVGHIEFSPLDNLAQYGWNKYVGGGAISAEGLGWPLHAIGDATEPHHIVASTGMGHRPYEDAVSRALDEIFPPDMTAHADQLTRIILGGYSWWIKLQQQPRVDKFIEAIARSTRDNVAANGEWPYHDTLSTAYQLGFTDTAISGYSGDTARIQPLVEMSSAAALAFLAYAGANAHTPAAVNTRCPSGTEYQILSGCTTVSPPTIPNNCLSEQTPCNVDADCSTGMFCQDHCCFVELL